MFKVLVTLAIVAFCGNATCSKLPSFVTPCKRSDPNLSECATKEAKKVLPQILDGLPDLKIPKMKPLKLPEVKIDVGNNLNVKLTDIDIYGIDDNNFKKFDIDLNAHKLKVKVSFSKLYLQSQYEINGKILVLPITGEGPANITFVDPDFDLTTDIEFFTRNGVEFAKINNAKITYTSKREYYVLQNLFNGDERLGSEMNKFLDENWQEVSKEIGPAIVEVISAVVTIIANGFFGRVPLDDLIPK